MHSVDQHETHCGKKGVSEIIKCVQLRSGCSQPFTCCSAGRHIDSFDLYKSIFGRVVNFVLLVYALAAHTEPKW